MGKEVSAIIFNNFWWSPGSAKIFIPVLHVTVLQWVIVINKPQISTYKKQSPKFSTFLQVVQWFTSYQK